MIRCRTVAVAAAVLGATMALSACSSSSSSTQSGGSNQPSGGGKQVAYLNFSVVNVYDKPIQDAAQKVASANGVTMTVFDGAADGSKQYSQLQDAISSGKYAGIMIQAVQSTNLIPLIKQAVTKGIKVVIVDQVVGPDLSTNEPQVPGIVTSVAIPPVQVGTRLGQLTVQACASQNPCKVGFIYGYRGSVTDNGLQQGFSSAIKSTPAVRLAAETQGLYTTQGGLSAAQNMYTAHSDLKVVIAADQSLVGAEQAAKQGGHKGISYIGYDGSSTALQKIASGDWFGGVQYPQNLEGTKAMQAMVDSLGGKAVAKAINVIDSLPNNDLITSASVSKFSPQDHG